jgi:hypothetical protein
VIVGAAVGVTTDHVRVALGAGALSGPLPCWAATVKVWGPATRPVYVTPLFAQGLKAAASTLHWNLTPFWPV